MLTTIAIILGIIMLVAFVALILLWAITEELPRANRTPYYERLEPGPYGVRLLSVGRRKMRAMRLINEVIGGDLGRAKYLVEHPPATIVEGISEEVARELLKELQETGAKGELFT